MRTNYKLDKRQKETARKKKKDKKKEEKLARKVQAPANDGSPADGE